MVERQLVFTFLQLVALSLPAFAILLQIMVESEMPYTYWAVPITTAGMGLFLIGGAIVVVELMFATATTTATVALGFALLGIFSMLIGVSLIGLQTGAEQRRLRDSGD
ncbi:hypothetical protein M0R89_09655 [Halorussus limi]|uniref:Uncharacterized protein n=1 Tax=Halorussus limi TaxID=2938695 RepID=A0A8U0HQ47_9EURY|nr:hypothetical protein [Halorussus limi]UPV72814.1 hypothetical protein M0R89_09655 [Halorussus limi]